MPGGSDQNVTISENGGNFELHFDVSGATGVPVALELAFRPGGKLEGSIQESTRFREDLAADSLDLYTLVQELEDSYGVSISDEEAARILTVGQAVDFVLASGAVDARSAAASQGPEAE